MTTGELITRASIWLAMAGWTLAIISRGKPPAIWIWAASFDLYSLHILFAYGVFYEWSNKIAWNHTANQTAEAIGVNTGIGLAINFVFLAILLTDIVLQWRGKHCCRNFIDGLVLFMIVNGAIVFGHGPVRAFGALLLGIVAAAWLRHGRGKTA